MITDSFAILSYLAAGASAISLFMILLWLISIRLRDASVIDRVWGVNFILLSFAYGALSQTLYWRSGLVFFLVLVWGLRLSIHIHLRNRGKPEDIRYQRMRERYGKSFWWKSLFVVFLFQGFLALVISAPILWVLGNVPQPLFGLWDFLGVCTWCVGFYFETVGDLQLARFKKSPSAGGRLLDTGLWALTRHPNYFGDALQWWGMFCFAMAVPYGIFAVVGPLIMSWLLRYVSGVALLEQGAMSTKPGFASYTKNTPAFVPRLPFGAIVRFAFLLLVKVSTRIFYRFEVDLIQPWPRAAWSEVRIAVLLNHTSLIEPIFCGVLPLRYLWRLSSHGIFPAAAETLNKPFVGALIRFLAPKVGALNRKRDDSWREFLASMAPGDTMIFLPEGRMKRPNGLDKHGQPMTVKRGIAEVLLTMKTGLLIFAYSGGLHHVQSPGQGLPKIFKTIRIKFEAVPIEEYLSRFQPTDTGDKASLPSIQEAIVRDLEGRRDRHCT